MLVCRCSPALGSRKHQTALTDLSKVHQRETSARPAQISHAMLTCDHMLPLKETYSEQVRWGMIHSCWHSAQCRSCHLWGPK